MNRIQTEREEEDDMKQDIPTSLYQPKTPDSTHWVNDLAMAVVVIPRIPDSV
jgi:hypothetical protein